MLTSRLAAGNRGQDDDDIAVDRRRLEPPGEAHVLVVDVNVDEPSQSLLLDESLLETGMTGLDILDHLKQGGAGTMDGLRSAGEGAQDRGNPYLYRHGVLLLVPRIHVSINVPRLRCYSVISISSSVTTRSSIRYERTSTGPSWLPDSAVDTST